MTLSRHKPSKLERWASKFKSGKKDTKDAMINTDIILKQEQDALLHDQTPVTNKNVTRCICCGNELKYPVDIYKVKCLVCTTYLSLDEKDSEIKNDNLILSYKTFKETLKIDPSNSKVKIMLEEIFSSHSSLNQSFIQEKNRSVSYDSPNLNFYDIKKFYYKLDKFSNQDILYQVLKSSVYLLKHPPYKLKFHQLNWLLIMFENTLLGHTLAGTSKKGAKIDILCYEIVKRLIGIFSNLESSNLLYLLHWWSGLPKDEFENKINLINLYLSFHINRLHYHATYDKQGVHISPKETENDILYKENYHMDITPVDTIQVPVCMYNDSWHIKTACHLLSCFKLINNKYHKVSETQFYNSSVEHINIIQDFNIWQLNTKRDKKERNLHNLTADILIMEQKRGYLGVSVYNGVYAYPSFTISEYSFLIPLSCKIAVLEQDSKRLMNILAEEALISSLVEGTSKNNDAYLRLRVHRDNITKDSLHQIMKKSSDVRKQLRIEFVGEPGIDGGGIKKEWFSLIINDIFDPRRGLIDYDNEMGFANLSSNSHHFRLLYLLGEIIGMAISNSIILNIRFPTVMYKKLLGHKTEFKDLYEMEPTIFNNLKKLSKMSDTEIKQLQLTFEITFSGKNYELISNGKDTFVTGDNVSLYVEKYASFIVDGRIEEQFSHFSKGFHNVVDSKAFMMFSPKEAQKLIIGDENENMKYDLYLLQTVTQYTCCSEEDNVVIWFWSFFEDLNVRKQHKLMKFITGTDMIPPLGINSMHFKVTKLEDIQKYSERLPVSHTCFNEICIWEYKSKEILAGKFIMAINESEGFTLK
ncbi:hypothetical protein CANINC_004285 [Pichia inconspicua]|uniref:HECT-type E3 ubiquitin transferase n=1 Tax=Pichia inconspicua TaxID=52247 RepID=A0A4T0WWI7_9ASCO|nr:hypothetical protein CANINC_004285 [[Candida] inconspicua]